MSDIPPAASTQHGNEVRPWRKVRSGNNNLGLHSGAPGSGPATAAVPNLLSSFEGVGQGFTGPAGTFTVAAAPPDPNGTVGPNHYIEVVNTDFAIFNKSGTPVYGPVTINTLWSGFGGLCQTNNDGDPDVSYDPIADRWVISQFALNQSAAQFFECVAVSQTADPTGAYFRYAFSYSNFPDYPKVSVWPDAYYVTYNMFNAAGTIFVGGEVCALDRAHMLLGQAATQQCTNPNPSFGGLLGASLDGTRQPPAGSPNYVVALGATDTAGNGSTLATWKFQVDWTNTANTTFTGPTTLTVAPYALACNGGTCIPQSGTAQRLDSLGDRLMYRLAYRNFGDHEALVTNHSVAAGSSVGVRWYELRPANGTVSLFQQGTYAPDSMFRWMGSIAQDQAGNIGLGFSKSSSGAFPSINYTGRLATDAAGSMTQGEGTVIAGGGAQSGSALSRWGDYTSMAVDPVDQCTFWYTNQYQAATGAFNWHTRVGTFKLPGCGATPPADDFSISASPSTVTVALGASGTSTISTALTSGSAQTVALSATGVPAGASASFNPTSVTAGSSSTLTLNSGSAAAGTYAVTVTGTGPSATHSTLVTFTINAAPPPNEFSIAVSPSSLSLVQGTSGTATVSTATTSGTAQTVSFSASGVPSGATASFSPTSITSGGSSTLTVNAGTAAAGSYALTITGTGASSTHATTLTLTVTASGGGAGITNGTFETGTLTAWTVAGTATATNAASHSGSYGARVGGTGPTNGDSSIAQTFTAPTSGGTLAAWYRVTCPDTITYDWARATLKDNTTGVTSTVLNKVCSNSGSWSQFTASLTAGHSYTLTLLSHDDNYAGDPTYTDYDDVAIGAPVATTSVQNGGFESGLTAWTSAGATSTTTTTVHSGAAAAVVGSTSPTNADSSLAQTFTAPSSATNLSFWYRVVCPDTVAYDWATVTLKDNTVGTTRTVLARTCTNSGAWVQVNASLTGGHSYTLTLVSHDDNYAGDATYTYYDDVVVR
ncbi:MAG TPA: hypothetical protein VGQ62_06515 [Chloroflexota bacterium]|nr:hypothetical protein [Chloroflexota bacterium]